MVEREVQCNQFSDRLSTLTSSVLSVDRYLTGRRKIHTRSCFQASHKLRRTQIHDIRMHIPSTALYLVTLRFM
jgi:hypothetical protein